MARSTKREKSSRGYKTNIWGMIRDIGIASLNKGQFPLALVGAIIIILIVKMPSVETSAFLHSILNGFKSFSILGWGLSFALSIGWVIHAKSLRRTFSKEIERISGEKKRLQEEVAKRKLQTTKKRK